MIKRVRHAWRRLLVSQANCTGLAGEVHNPLLSYKETLVFDPLSTLFSEAQRESHCGLIGKQQHDRRTYVALSGDGDQPPTPRRRPVRAALVPPGLAAAGVLGAVLYWLAHLFT
jgi:hypothetical protein